MMPPTFTRSVSSISSSPVPCRSTSTLTLVQLLSDNYIGINSNGGGSSTTASASMQMVVAAMVSMTKMVTTLLMTHWVDRSLNPSPFAFASTSTRLSSDEGLLDIYISIDANVERRLSTSASMSMPI
ncbi:hypothetical protein BHM03_00039353 [Ensete ventricosum]|nr:hypothetical protein BHM03_00039353 [Ensete ventricosum]